MDDGFCGPAPSGVEAISRLLRLSITGKEQDWEIEFADPERIEEMFGILKGGDLDLDAQSALALLALHSMDEGASLEMSKLVSTAREIFDASPIIRNRMRSYWGRLSAGEVVAKVLA